jgi:hypothetical protein
MSERTVVLEGYDGPADLVAAGTEVRVEVRLRGLFQPLDGRYHWHGRLAVDGEVDALVESLVESRASVVLRTPQGDARARLADRDPWGRYRVTGTGRPPFAR